MELMTESWTDEKLDGLKQEMELRFDHVDQRFEHVDQRFKEVDRRFDELDKRLDKIDKRFEAFDMRFETLNDHLGAMYRVMIVFGGSMFAAMATLVAALIATHV